MDKIRSTVPYSSLYIKLPLDLRRLKSLSAVLSLFKSTLFHSQAFRNFLPRDFKVADPKLAANTDGQSQYRTSDAVLRATRG